MKTGQHLNDLSHACRKARSGSVVTIVLVSVILMGVGLLSYSSLVSNQNQSIVRSQVWNATIPVAEAGIEEAMAHINKHNKLRIQEGWALAPDATNVVKQRTMGDSKYRVYLNAYQEPPLILAEGYVRHPRTKEWVGPRNVLIETVIDPLITKVLAAKGTIDLSGSEITTDSFDSTDANYSTGGQYDPTKNKDNGDIATNSSLVDSLNIGNANIMGEVATGPGGTVYVGPDGAVGSKTYHESGSKGIESGWVRDDMNVHFPDVTVPPPLLVGMPPLFLGGSLSLGTGDYTLNTGLTLSGTQKLTVSGTARLYVRGSVDIGGEAKIELLPGASLELYVLGPSTKIGGKGLVNGSNSALNFSYYGLPSNTSIAISGDSDFIGAIYAPSAALTLKGGGVTPLDFIGGAVANTVKLTGQFDFHFDEALLKTGPRRWYVPTSWNETKGWAKL